ncbi:MAG: Maf family protein [Planctomycetota bacterium]
MPDGIEQSQTKQDLPRMVLASASPRRKQIFESAGFRFEIMDPGDAEDAVNSAHTPEQLAIDKARAKARAAAEKVQGPYPALVIGADTLVAAHERVIGKPLDRADAVAILSGLSGTRHCVISGVCVIAVFAGEDAGHPRVERVSPLEFAESTWVTMKSMSPEAIAEYVNSGQSDGKAGAYAIQENGDQFVERIEGCFLNVVGFPLERFKAELPAVLDQLNFGASKQDRQ